MYVDTMYDHHGNDHVSMRISMIKSMMHRWNVDDGVDDDVTI